MDGADGAKAGGGPGAGGSLKGGLTGLPQRPAARQQQAPEGAPSEAQPAAPASKTARPAGLGGSGLLNPSRPAPQPTAPTAPAHPPAAVAAPRAGAAERAESKQAAVHTGAVVSGPAAAALASVVDQSDGRDAQRAQQQVHDFRVRLLRAAARLGIPTTSDVVAHFMRAIDQAERARGQLVYKGTRSIDLAAAAEREARQREGQEAVDSPLDLHLKIMVIGLAGTGKSQLINALLERPAAPTSSSKSATSRVRVVRGNVKGVRLTFIDTPGLHASASHTSQNRAILGQIRSAYRHHKPDHVFYVDRLDAARPGLGELPLLGLVTQVMGASFWRGAMALLTHAHAARQVFGAQYDQVSRQRRSIVNQLIGQAAGSAQARSPTFLVDSHPDCPKNSFGQAVVVENNTNVPWKQQLLLQLVGFKAYKGVDGVFKNLGKRSSKAQPAGMQQDMFRQMMRSRLPSLHFFLEQLTEGVLKPDGWGTLDDPLNEATEDEEAEGFNHMYYQLMYQLAKAGDAWAQREYAAMLQRLAAAKAEVAQAYDDAELDAQLESAYESTLTDPIDFGPTFDPEDMYSHRHSFPEAAAGDVQVIPSQDYYGPEHDDPLNGIVMQYQRQPFNTNGWGGLPMDLTLCVEKDKSSLCLQGETHWSLVHSVPPFGSRHITQVCGSWEVLRPNIKDVMYQLEVNTFKDGLLLRGDHAGCGAMVARLGEGGNPSKGPMAVGLRLQDSFRAGPFKVEACAAKVYAEGPTGAKDEGWGARSFIHYDWLPGVGLAVDYFQQKVAEDEGKRARGFAVNVTYDWEMLGAACDVEVDYIVGANAVQVGMSVFSGNDYRFAWLLAVPAWKYLTALLASALQRGGAGDGQDAGDDELGDEEEEEEDEADGMGMAIA